MWDMTVNQRLYASSCDLEAFDGNDISKAVVLMTMSMFQENYNTPLEHTRSAIPLANYERNPIIACW